MRLKILAISHKPRFCIVPAKMLQSGKSDDTIPHRRDGNNVARVNAMMNMTSKWFLWLTYEAKASSQPLHPKTRHCVMDD